jgi:hypothetical protein
MHGEPPIPEHIKTLRELLALIKGNAELESAVVAFAAATHKYGLTIGCEMGYAEGLRQGHIRGRRKAKGLPEIAKPRGRPKSVARLLREAGLTWEDFNEI